MQLTKGGVLLNNKHCYQVSPGHPSPLMLIRNMCLLPYLMTFKDANNSTNVSYMDSLGMKNENVKCSP